MMHGSYDQQLEAHNSPAERDEQTRERLYRDERFGEPDHEALQAEIDRQARNRWARVHAIDQAAAAIERLVAISKTEPADSDYPPSRFRHEGWRQAEQYWAKEFADVLELLKQDQQ